MFKKELREIWKPALLRLGVVLAIPVIMTVMAALSQPDAASRLPSFILSTFPYALIWISNYLGVTAFKAEFEDRALEYWLTFPLKGGNRLIRKIFARSVVVLLLILLYGTLTALFDVRTSLVLPFAIVAPGSLLFFINGCLCGFLGDRNLRMAANVVTFFSVFAISMGLSPVLYPLFPENNQALSVAVVFVISLFLVIGIMGGFWILSARRLDLRSPDLFKKRVRAFGLPLILALDIAALIFRSISGRA